jgi:hypothetical protein
MRLTRASRTDLDAVGAGGASTRRWSSDARRLSRQFDAGRESGCTASSIRARPPCSAPSACTARRAHARNGYWVRTAVTRQGYATEAVAELTGVVFETTDVARPRFRCDLRNAQCRHPSPPRLSPRGNTAPTRSLTGTPRDTWWSLTRQELASVTRDFFPPRGKVRMGANSQVRSTFEAAGAAGPDRPLPGIAVGRDTATAHESVRCAMAGLPRFVPLLSPISPQNSRLSG